MNSNEFSKLSNEEIEQEIKKLKSNSKTQGVLIGLFVGIAIYALVKNGFGFSSFFPIILVVILLNNRKKISALENELTSRNQH